MTQHEDLIRNVLTKICQDYYKTPLLTMIRQWGEMNDEFNDGLRHFAVKLYCKGKYRLPDCLSDIYSFFVYSKPLDVAKLENYINSKQHETN